MFGSLRSLFRSRHPLDAENLGQRARDISFRVMEEADIPTCLAFYRANEAAHFPPGVFEHYETQLRGGKFLNLIATRAGVPVGCCGLHYITPTDGLPCAVFCFGMVDPKYQRQGVGTAQALVRLALLPVTCNMAAATMYAVPGSVSFYQRFGFRFEREAVGSDGRLYPFGLLTASQSFIDDCRSVLLERNISYPEVRGKDQRAT